MPTETTARPADAALLRRAADHVLARGWATPLGLTEEETARLRALADLLDGVTPEQMAALLGLWAATVNVWRPPSVRMQPCLAMWRDAKKHVDGLAEAAAVEEAR